MVAFKLKLELKQKYQNLKKIVPILESRIIRKTETTCEYNILWTKKNYGKKYKYNLYNDNKYKK